MPRYVFVVHSNPVPGREDEYNDWYLKRHMPAMQALPGVVSARRYRLSPVQLGTPETAHQYVAMYEVETDQPQAFFDAMVTSSRSGRLPSSTSLAPGATVVMWEQVA